MHKTATSQRLKSVPFQLRGPANRKVLQVAMSYSRPSHLCDIDVPEIQATVVELARILADRGLTVASLSIGEADSDVYEASGHTTRQAMQRPSELHPDQPMP